MIIHNMAQKSEAWFEIKKLKMSASHAQEIGNASKGLESYTTELVTKFFSNSEEETYTNKDMERGNELESEARTIYEFEKDIVVKEVGFVEHSKYVGVSPDGLIFQSGFANPKSGIEIKCPKDTKYIQYLMKPTIESKYLWQMNMIMLVCELDHMDYVVYNPNFQKSFHIMRITPDQDKFERLRNGFKVGEKMLIEKFEKVKAFMEV